MYSKEVMFYQVVMYCMLIGRIGLFVSLFVSKITAKGHDGSMPYFTQL